MREEGFLNAPFSQSGLWGPLTSDVFFSEPRKNLTTSLQLLSARLCPTPSGAMLLLVTLALLAGPTCRAQNILGNNVGTYFYVAGEEHGQLRGLRIFLTVIDLIKGIQLRFGGNWSDVYGSRSLKYKEFLLEDGEHVTQVSGTRKLCLTSLSFTTNKGRVVTFGVRRGLSFNESGGSDKYLVTVNGLYAPGLCLNGMGFKWKNIHDDFDDNDDDKEDDDDEHDDDNEEDHGDKDNDKDHDDDHDDDDDDKEDDNEEDVDDERDDKDDDEEEDDNDKENDKDDGEGSGDDDDNDDEDDDKDDDGGSGNDDDDGDDDEDDDGGDDDNGDEEEE
eukprot:XP_017452528.1 PREDICTED: prostatic spermine-binding protein isoform X1 [Rattus norvegicus]